MKTTLLFLAIFVALVGCAATHSVDVQYYNLSPLVVGASAISESTSPTGPQLTVIDRFLIDKNGNVTPLRSDSSTTAGPLSALAQGAITSGAMTTGVGAVLPLLLPSNQVNVNTGKK